MDFNSYQIQEWHDEDGHALFIDDPVNFSGVDADLIALARAMLYDPRWPWHAAAHFGAQIRAPKQYLRSQPNGLRNLFF
jgi:hypothetical protein